MGPPHSSLERLTFWIHSIDEDVMGDESTSKLGLHGLIGHNMLWYSRNPGRVYLTAIGRPQIET